MIQLSGDRTVLRTDPNEVPGHIVSFSGYPAALSSADDYTLTSAGLASIETTIAIFNNTLYTDLFIKPEGQIHCWIRSFISNALTKGFTSSRDMTWFLKKYSYWPSYNIPYLSDISIISGFSRKGEEFNWYKWGSSPRARIFERDHHKVQDIDSLTKLMRFKPKEFDLPKDILAKKKDIYKLTHNRTLYFQGTNYEMFSKLRFRAWGGPPYDPLPVFNWNTTKVVANHFGQPQVWNFTYVNLEWETVTKVLDFE
uniref:Phospholipase B-like n=1 Tax=Heterorhabditis bacteriophora TaxID=37862 RepID=A0A1I7X953_HETBA